MRIPGGPPSQRRIEHRVAGADTNAYLVMAAILGAVLAGIEGNMQPPNPIRSSAYGTGHADMPRLPLCAGTRWMHFPHFGKMLDEFIPGIMRDMVIKTSSRNATVHRNGDAI